MTFTKPKELAIALEYAEKDVKDLQVNPPPIEVLATSDVHVVQPPSVCHRCGGKHLPSACRFRGAECYECHKKGHLARVCKSQATRQSTHQVQVTQNPEQDPVYTMYNLPSQRYKPLQVSLNIEERDLKMEIDTGHHCRLLVKVRSTMVYWESSSTKTLPCKASDIYRGGN